MNAKDQPRGSDVRPLISRLVKLQETELEIRRLNHELGGVDRRLSELEAGLREERTALDAVRARLQEIGTRNRALESDLKDIHLRVDRSQERLRSVKTNKEYQSGLKEIEDLKAMAARVEDELLGLLEESEAAQRDLKEREAALQARAAEVEAEKATVLAEAQGWRNRLAELEDRARSLAAEVPEAVLARYRRVLGVKKDGVAVAPVSGSVCRGCNVNIPPQMYNELQRMDRLQNCPNCERIIFWKEEEDRSE
ncbi:MAG: C4-type zinc ribbon domain-containing protein [Desulfobacterales bacterium]